MQCSQAMLDGMKELGVDPEPILDSYIKLYNDCIRDAPKDMIIGVHLCVFFSSSTRSLRADG